MCAALTENVVLVRTRSHDLNSVKKLNCWGCALKDVSIVHRMPRLEVISLSINSIESLADFAECNQLQELYLRKNEIKDINQVMYLTQLECLKKLSLEDNPCTQTENYRFTVVKALPSLEYLDNIRVTPDEIYEAEKYGLDLVWPGAAQELAEIDEQYEPQPPEPEPEPLPPAPQQLQPKQQQQQQQVLPPPPQIHQQPQQTQVSHSHHNNHQDNEYSSQQHQPQHTQAPTVTMRHASQQSLSNTSNSSNHAESGYCQSSADETMSVHSAYAPVSAPVHRASTASHHGHYNPSNSSNNNHHHAQQSQQSGGIQSQQHHGSTQMMPGTPKKTNMSKCTSMSDYALYNNGNGNNHYGRPMSPTQSEYNFDVESQSGGIASHRMSEPFGAPVGYRPPVHHRTSSMSNQNRFLPKGGRNRNANILSAVLCLIKELDYASLEVVDTTIHCRMEEMED